MKAVTEKRRKTAANAWGRDGTFDEQVFEVEEADVGTTRHHYLGYNHRSVQITQADVGRQIHMQTSPGWACWTWHSGNIST